MAYLLQVLTPPNTRLGDCLLPSAKEEVLGRPLMVTTLLLPLAHAQALAVYLSHSLTRSLLHTYTCCFRYFVLLLFLLFLLSILAILLFVIVVVVTFVLCPGTEDEHTTTKEDDEDKTRGRR